MWGFTPADGIDWLEESLDERAREQFGPMERRSLMMAMAKCSMIALPAIILGDDLNGERCSGMVVCEKCQQLYVNHPLDWRVTGYDGRPHLHVLCDGRRVKL